MSYLKSPTTYRSRSPNPQKRSSNIQRNLLITIIFTIINYKSKIDLQQLFNSQRSFNVNKISE